MDIFIKSFLRPYYLDRCLQSIYKHVSGDFSVTIIDDGTADAYLEQISAKFPLANIVKTSTSNLKRSLVDEHLQGTSTYSMSTIPTETLKECVHSASKFFLMLEEDAWITAPVLIDHVQSMMSQYDLLILKLGWNSSQGIVYGNKVPLSATIEKVEPSLPVESMVLMEPYFGNYFWIRSLLTKLGVVDIKSILPYYLLYTVSSAFFSREYWLYLWGDAGAKIEESRQLLQALRWKKLIGEGGYAKTIEESCKTSFITASTNRLKSTEFDMIRLNSILSHFWSIGALDHFENFPGDFSVTYLQEFIRKENDPLCTIEGWHAWISTFKRMYQKAGAAIE